MSAEFTINDEIQVNLQESEIHHLITGRTYPIGSNESELLKYFIAHPNEVITRQVLIDKVWVSKGIYVEDGSLMQTISICRKALEDKSGAVIVTERGKGYRFAGKVTLGSKPINNQEVLSEEIKPEDKSQPWVLIGASFIVSVAAAYYGVGQLSKNIGKDKLNQKYHLTCTIQSDELTFNKMYNVTLYEYKDRKIIIDNEGKSLSFPSKFEGVTCE
ncbi:transcriptional regulator [Vibrio profundi]|uniref:winged helix-turn-helix domain-containing protein n=1 Tax=Vibrio profundi TaxID=1774960 RepID=UPI003735B0F1